MADATVLTVIAAAARMVSRFISEFPACEAAFAPRSSLRLLPELSCIAIACLQHLLKKALKKVKNPCARATIFDACSTVQTSAFAASKRDYVRVNPIPDAATALARIDQWMSKRNGSAAPGRGGAALQPRLQCRLLAPNGHAAAVAACLLLSDERTWLGRGPRSEFDPKQRSEPVGCVA